jgi:shikimate kinase
MQTECKDIKSRIVKPITLIGLMGSGKSMLGKRLAKQLDMPFADSDKAIEDTAGLTISDIFDIAGDAKFREMEERIISEMVKKGPLILATGGGAICRANTAELLLEQSVVVWLQAAPETLMARIGTTATRPLLAGDDPLGKLRQLSVDRQQHYQKAHIHLNTDGMSGEKALVTLIDALDSFLPVT